MENLTYSGATPKASFPLEETRLPIPKWYVPAFFAVLVVSLALPHGTNRIILTLPVALGLVSMLYNHTDGSFKKDYDLGNLVLGWFLVYLSLILTNPERVFWKRDGRDLTADERFKEAQSKSFWQKLPWSFGVWTNPRGIGWSHEAPGLRRAAPEGYPLWKFVARKLVNAAFLMLATDLLHLWYKSLQRSSLTQPWSVWSEPFPIRTILGLSNQFRIYTEMASMHSLAAAITTALGIYQPNDWAPMVGHISDSYTIKRWWGMVWHQFMRQVAHSGGLLVSRDLLRLRKGSFAARFTYLIAAFASTGFYHTMVNIYATNFRSWNPCGDMEYFVLQGMGVFVEGLVIDQALRWGFGKNKAWKYVGYLWWACWLGNMQLWYVERLRQDGLWDVDTKILQYIPGLSV